MEPVAEPIGACPFIIMAVYSRCHFFGLAAVIVTALFAAGSAACSVPSVDFVRRPGFLMSWPCFVRLDMPAR
jgi:hypothetical protein